MCKIDMGCNFEEERENGSCKTPRRKYAHRGEQKNAFSARRDC